MVWMLRYLPMVVPGPERPIQCAAERLSLNEGLFHASCEPNLALGRSFFQNSLLLIEYIEKGFAL